MKDNVLHGPRQKNRFECDSFKVTDGYLQKSEALFCLGTGVCFPDVCLALTSAPLRRLQKRGRPRERWIDSIEEDLRDWH
ncbi:hypothetical protein CEXT_6571 [Caerostris extrusa]|uniref:Uncharacterized protein n=1 Tax=Caerostris extrusa TaxID=172846 RepID=A0AAV4X4D0_CAEEX|nr:hypothetical protein CEXT_6571 [Caerostris extrusa]